MSNVVKEHLEGGADAYEQVAAGHERDAREYAARAARHADQAADAREKARALRRAASAPMLSPDVARAWGYETK